MARIKAPGGIVTVCVGISTEQSNRLKKIKNKSLFVREGLDLRFAKEDRKANKPTRAKKPSDDLSLVANEATS